MIVEIKTLISNLVPGARPLSGTTFFRRISDDKSAELVMINQEN
jgi:hypothetical protein